MQGKVSPKNTACEHCGRFFTARGVKEHVRHHCPANPNRRKRVFTKSTCLHCGKRMHSAGLRVHVASVHPEKYARSRSVKAHRAPEKPKKSEAKEARRHSKESPRRVSASPARHAPSKALKKFLPQAKARKSNRIAFGRRSRSALEKGDLAVRRRCGVSKSHKIRKWAAYRKLRASALVGPGCCRIAEAQPFRCCRAAAKANELQGCDFLQHLSRCLVFFASYARLWMLPGAPCRSRPSPAGQAKPAARRKFRTTLRAAGFF